MSQSEQAPSTPDTTGNAAGVWRPTVALIVAVVAFAVQQTSIVPAIDDVRRALGGTREWSSWLVTVYLVVATVATMAMGRLGDLYGRRRLLLIGLGLFAMGSVGGTFAPNLPVLIICRAVQGVGGSVYPLALALARQQAPPRRTTMALSLVTGAFGAGTAIGFVAGAALAQLLTWRAIFALGAVLVLVAAALAARFVGETGERAAGGYDVTGTVVLTVAVIALLGGLTLVTSIGPGSLLTVALLVVAVLAIGYGVWHTLRVEHPLTDLSIFRLRPVAFSNLATIGMGWTLFGSYLLVPEFARADPARGYGLGASVLLTGLLLLPSAVGQMVAATLAGRLTRRIPARAVFAAGLVLLAAATAILAVSRTGWAPVTAAMLLLGAGAGTVLQSASTVATETVAADVAAASASVNSTVRRLAGGVGGQLSTLVLLAMSGTGFAGFTVAYAIAGGLCVLGIPAALSGVRRAPAAAADV